MPTFQFTVKTNTLPEGAPIAVEISVDEHATNIVDRLNKMFEQQSTRELSL